VPLPINRVPPGLLSLLDTKSGGVNPLQLADQLTGVIELTNLYALATGQQLLGTTAAVSSIGNFAPVAAGENFRALPGELWYVPYINVRMSAALGANEEITGALSIYNTSLGNLIWTGPTRTFTGGQRASFSTDRPIVIGPNFGIGIEVHGWDSPVANTFAFFGYVAKLRF